MITANVIHRVFRIRHVDREGTGFVIEVEGKEYLVTAKHLVENLKDQGKVSLFSNGKWREIEVTVVGHSPGEADISVLATEEILAPPNLQLDANQAHLVYGQDVYFLGFPYGYPGHFVLGEHGYPLPFVKKAIVSLLEDRRMILDGHNNEGFSGGPVVCTEPNKNVFRVVGVISAYRCVEQPVFDDGKETGLTYEYNTGLIEADSISWALGLIQANPIGQTVI